VRTGIEAQRSKLAAIEVTDARVRQAIQEAFVAGYRRVLLVAVVLALASSLTATLLIKAEAQSKRR
jgi:hypothetical protein